MFCQIQCYYCSQLHTIKHIQTFTVIILNYVFWITLKTFSNSNHCVLQQLYCVKHTLSRLHNTVFLISDTESILHKAYVFLFFSQKILLSRIQNSWKHLEMKGIFYCCWLISKWNIGWPSPISYFPHCFLRRYRIKSDAYWIYRKLTLVIPRDSVYRFPCHFSSNFCVLIQFSWKQWGEKSDITD